MFIMAMVMIVMALARVYPPGSEKGLIAGTAASAAVHAGEVEKPGAERATAKNADLAHVTDLANTREK